MNDNEIKLKVASFMCEMLNVLDTYNKEEDCMERCIRIETSLPSLKRETNLTYVIEWDIKDQKWIVESENDVHYGITSEMLVKWYYKLIELNAIETMDWDNL